MFGEYLKEVHFNSHPMLLDDDIADSYDSWVSELDIADLIDYGNDAMKSAGAKVLGSIKSEKKSKSSAENGKMGGRPNKKSV